MVKPKPRKRRRNSLRFYDQSLSQMEAQYRAVDREFILKETKPLSAADRRLWRKASSRGKNA
jgi:hypothetical protein